MTTVHCAVCEASISYADDEEFKNRVKGQRGLEITCRQERRGKARTDSSASSVCICLLLSAHSCQPGSLQAFIQRSSGQSNICQCIQRSSGYSNICTSSYVSAVHRVRTSLSVSLGRPSLHTDNMTQSAATLPITDPSSRQPADTTATAVAAPAAPATTLPASSPGIWLDANSPLSASNLLRAGATTAPGLTGAASASAVASDVFSSHGQPVGLDQLEHVNVFCSQAAKRDILAFLHAQAALVDVSAEARAAMGHIMPAESSSIWSTASWVRPGATTVSGGREGMCVRVC